MKNRIRGFTAIELMVVVSIVAILSAVAMPSFSRFIAKLQVEQDIEAFRASVMLARSEAMKRGGNIELRKLDASATGLPTDTCRNRSNWSCGWEVVSTSTTPVEVIRQYPTKGKNDIGLNSPSSSSPVSLNRWGLSTLGFSIGVQHKKYSSEDFNKRVCISSGGAINVADNCTS